MTSNIDTWERLDELRRDALARGDTAAAAIYGRAMATVGGRILRREAPPATNPQMTGSEDDRCIVCGERGYVGTCPTCAAEGA